MEVRLACELAGSESKELQDFTWLVPCVEWGRLVVHLNSFSLGLSCLLRLSKIGPSSEFQILHLYVRTGGDETGLLRIEPTS